MHPAARHVAYAQRFGVTGFPTLILFDDGRPVGQHVGMADMPALLRYAGVRGSGSGAPGGNVPVAQVAAVAAAPPAALDLILSGACCAGACSCKLTALRRAARRATENAQAGLFEEIAALRRELKALPGDGAAAAARHVDAISVIVSASSKLR